MVVEQKATYVYHLKGLPESALMALEGSPYQTTEQQIIKESDKRSKKMTSPAIALSTCRYQAVKLQNFRGSFFFPSLTSVYLGDLLQSNS